MQQQMTAGSFVYLDNSSTTKPCLEAVQAVLHSMEENWGNPSSLHSLGFQAERAVEDARQAVADALSCRSEEILFVSGGTEGNNLAILGAAYARKKQGTHLVTSAIEHPAVLHVMQYLEKEGFSVTYLRPDAQGRISARQVWEAVTPETILVSLMAVNNETGVLLPLEAASQAIREKKAPALFHVDAVQAFGKIPLKPESEGIDLLTLSGHKIHGPKGIGALYIRRGVHLAPRIFGGAQEKGKRPGTEGTPLIAGLGAAVRALPLLAAEEKRIREINLHLRRRLANLPEVTLLSPEDALPYILNLSAGQVSAETMLHFLSSKGIFVSSGSACAKGKTSHVLKAMGVPAKQIASALRVSFSRMNTIEDTDRFADALEEGLHRLVRRR